MATDDPYAPRKARNLLCYVDAFFFGLVAYDSMSKSRFQHAFTLLLRAF